MSQVEKSQDSSNNEDQGDGATVIINLDGLDDLLGDLDASSTNGNSFGDEGTGDQTALAESTRVNLDDIFDRNLPADSQTKASKESKKDHSEGESSLENDDLGDGGIELSLKDDDSEVNALESHSSSASEEDSLVDPTSTETIEDFDLEMGEETPLVGIDEQSQESQAQQQEGDFSVSGEESVALPVDEAGDAALESTLSAEKEADDVAAQGAEEFDLLQDVEDQEIEGKKAKVQQDIPAPIMDFPEVEASADPEPQVVADTKKTKKEDATKTLNFDLLDGGAQGESEKKTVTPSKSPESEAAAAIEELQEFDFRSMVGGDAALNPYSSQSSPAVQPVPTNKNDLPEQKSQLVDPHDLFTVGHGESQGKTTTFVDVPSQGPQEKRVFGIEDSSTHDFSQEHKTFTHYHENELLKLSAIIKSLREDREKLIQKMEHYQQDLNTADEKKRQSEAFTEELKIELSVSKKQYQEEIERLNYHVKILLGKKEIIGEQNKKMKEELEEYHKKHYVDGRKIRERELDLENKLELLKADAQSQLLTREQKMTELKRHIDNLEFERETFLKNEKSLRDQNKILENKLQKILSTLSNGLDLLQVPEYDSQKNRLIKKVKL
jgi:hypothetical protein